MFFKFQKNLFFLFFIIGTFTSVVAQETTAEFDSNFVHVVYFWLHNPDDQEDRKLFETTLNTFLDASEYTKTNFLGKPPKAIRDVVDDSFTYNLIVTFDSEAAQEKYQNEAAHLAFIEKAKHLWKKVVVYDAIPLNN